LSAIRQTVYVEPVTRPVLRPLDLGEILDVAVKIATRNIGTLVRIVLFVVLPAQILIAIVDVSAISNYRPTSSIFPSTSGTANANEAWTQAAATLVTVIVGFLAGQFATGACFRAVTQAYLGLETGWQSSLSFAARRFHSILWIVILGGFLWVIGLLFCLIPGIYLVVSFAVALPVLMAEGQRGRKALGRSRRLVRGRWWWTLLILVVAGLLASIVSGMISGAISAVGFASGSEPISAFLITAIAGTAGALVATPFSAAYHTVLYFDLRVRKEAFDLQLIASGLGVEPPPGWEPPPVMPGPTAQPPYWPPPADWHPPPPGRPQPPPAAPEPPSDQPPFWPPPPGWRPGNE
jgi:hypothetical protein